MNTYEVIALTLHSNDNSVNGRTAIQKLIYFISQNDVPGVNINSYTHYFYGPFSIDVASTLGEMSAFSYINEIVHSGFHENYEYSLTTKGREYAKNISEQYPNESKQISHIVKVCKEFCELRTSTLSFAAKAHYVLANTTSNHTNEYTADDVSRVATDFDWKISPDDAKNGISLLQELGLVGASQRSL